MDHIEPPTEWQPKPWITRQAVEDILVCQIVLALYLILRVVLTN